MHIPLQLALLKLASLQSTTLLYILQVLIHHGRELKVH